VQNRATEIIKKHHRSTKRICYWHLKWSGVSVHCQPLHLWKYRTMATAQKVKDPFWPQQPWGKSHTSLFQECVFCERISCWLKEATDAMLEKKQAWFGLQKETGWPNGHLLHCDGGMTRTGFIHLNRLSKGNWLFRQKNTLHSHRMGREGRSSCQPQKGKDRGAHWWTALTRDNAAALSPLQSAWRVNATTPHATALPWGPNSNCHAYEGHQPLWMKQVLGFHVIMGSLE